MKDSITTTNIETRLLDNKFTTPGRVHSSEDSFGYDTKLATEQHYEILKIQKDRADKALLLDILAYAFMAFLVAIAAIGVKHLIRKIKGDEKLRHQDVLLQFDTKFFSNTKFVAICHELDTEIPVFQEPSITAIDRYNFCTFYADISIELKRGRLDAHQVLNSLGTFAIKAAECSAFLKNDIRRESFSYTQFFEFADRMKTLRKQSAMEMRK